MASPGAVNISRSQLLLGRPVEGDLLPAVGGEPHPGVPHLGAGGGAGGGGEVNIRHPNLEIQSMLKTTSPSVYGCRHTTNPTSRYN